MDGQTADSNTMTITTDPTASRTFTLPDTTGTALVHNSGVLDTSVTLELQTTLIFAGSGRRCPTAARGL